MSNNNHRLVLAAALSSIDSAIIPTYETAEDPTVGLKDMLFVVPSEYRAEIIAKFVAVQNATFRDLGLFIRQAVELNSLGDDEILFLRSIEAQSILEDVATEVASENRKAAELRACSEG